MENEDLRREDLIPANMEKFSVVVLENPYLDGWVSFTIRDDKGAVFSEMHVISGNNQLN